MDWVLIVLTLLCFVGGTFMSRWQARRAFRDNVKERLTKEVEKELARRAMEKFARQNRHELETDAGPKTRAK